MSGSMMFSQKYISVFFFRLRDISNRISTKPTNWPPALAPLANLPIKELAIGPNSVAFLLQVTGVSHYEVVEN